MLVIGAFTSVAGTLGNISSTFVAVDQHTTFLEDYFSFLSIDPLRAGAEPRRATCRRSLEAGIEFDDVTFTYPGGTEPAVANLNLHIRGGELIALVGENGAGKSTLVKLLLRFYDPIAGRGARRRRRPARARSGGAAQPHRRAVPGLRQLRAVGARERADGPARRASTTIARVLAALEDARSDWLVKKMPKGLDAKVGRLFEGGHDLSGGEWQRLALARIMYRDADIWILDEPTSSLDPEAEAAIFAELKEILKGRIGIVISHRFSTVRIADRIAVIADGKVTELGSHEELLQARRPLRAAVRAASGGIPVTVLGPPLRN